MWIVMGMILEDVLNVMKKVDVCVVVKKFGLLDDLFLRCVLDYIVIECNVFKGYFKWFCIKNFEIEWLVIRMMS